MSLAGAGAGAGALGGGLRIGGLIHGQKSVKALHKLKDAIIEDISANKDLKDKIQDLINHLGGAAHGISFKIFTGFAPAGAQGLFAFTNIMGFPSLMALIEFILKPLNKCCITNKMLQDFLDLTISTLCGAAAGVLYEISEEAAKSQAGKIAAEAVKHMEEGVAKKQAHYAALKAAEQVIKNSSDEAAETALKMGTQKAAETAAKTAAENTIKIMAKITGGIMVGLGGIFLIWEIYNTVVDAKKESMFVKDLLKIAEQLESQKDKDVINLAKMEMSRNEE